MNCGQQLLDRFGSRTHVGRLFKKYADAAGHCDVRFHDLRHTFASHLVMAGVSLKSVQELMRHKDIGATMIYAKVSAEYLRAAVNSLHFGPMDLGLGAKSVQVPDK